MIILKIQFSSEGIFKFEVKNKNSINEFCLFVK